MQQLTELAVDGTRLGCSTSSTTRLSGMTESSYTSDFQSLNASFAGDSMPQREGIDSHGNRLLKF